MKEPVFSEKEIRYMARLYETYYHKHRERGESPHVVFVRFQRDLRNAFAEMDKTYRL